MSWPSGLRLALQLGAGSLVVHELRYRLGHGHDGRSLSDHGHGYLAVVTPLVALLVVAAVAHFAWAMWIRRSGAMSAGAVVSARTFALALLALHFGQEGLEGILAFEHPRHAAAILSDGGWFALTLCCAVAAMRSGLGSGARRLARAMLECSSAPAPGQRHGRFRVPPAVPGRPGPPLARLGAERAPPLLGS